MDEMRQRAIELVKKYCDELAPGILGINVDGSGKVSFTAEPECEVNSLATYYPTLAEYQLPTGSIKTILRSEITELDRMSTQLDLVPYAGLGRGAFKYSMNWRGFGSMWQEIHILARLPRHPHILPLHRLVLDELTGSRVVGFTSPYMPGGDLEANKTRPFKPKYLNQLIQVVDDLNYKFGIIHQDVAPRNLFIDPATANLVLFDFDTAAKIGQNIKLARFDEATPERKSRNDVKGVVLTIHELLTRDPCYNPSWLHLLDETNLLAGPEKWVKHPDVQLDPGLDAVDYYRELMCWVGARGERPAASGPSHRTPKPPTGRQT
jgi:hypothetical protein